MREFFCTRGALQFPEYAVSSARLATIQDTIRETSCPASDIRYSTYRTTTLAADSAHYVLVTYVRTVLLWTQKEVRPPREGLALCVSDLTVRVTP